MTKNRTKGTVKVFQRRDSVCCFGFMMDDMEEGGGTSEFLLTWLGYAVTDSAITGHYVDGFRP